MGRRKSDRFMSRLNIIMCALACALALLASVIGYKAISTLNDFRNAVQAMSAERALRRAWPMDG